MQNKIKNQGLTLVEVAIVLVILGLLIGLGASLIGPLTKRAKINETKEIINAAVESVVGFAAKNNRIPTNTEFPQAVGNSNDAWTKPLVYFFYSTLTASPNNPAEGICGRKTTNLIVCTDADCISQIQDVAFIVVSGGPNYNVQTGSLTTSPCPSGKTCYKVYPQDYPNVDDYPPDLPEGSRPEEYDDIVKWITLDELRIKAGCQGAQLKILNNELPYGYVNSAYNATIYAEGGVPFTSGGKYKWCIQGNLLPGLSFNPSTSSTDCLSLAENSWGSADILTISGTPTVQGSYTLTFFVRDDQDPNGSNDNIAQKTLVLTINPSSIGGGCTTYSLIISNQGNEKSYRNDSGTCRKIDNNESHSLTGLISNNILTIYSGSGCSGNPLLSGSMQNLDSNGNCVVNVSCQGNNCSAN